VVIEGQELKILPEEVEVRLTAKEGFSVASEGAYLAALVTDLTPELIQEGLARELVRRIQDLRKQADLEIADRIRLYYQASAGMETAIMTYREYIMGETLAVEMVPGSMPAGVMTGKDEVDGEEISIGLVKVSSN
jgi:isoleucyl-tRNA synthetase